MGRRKKQEEKGKNNKKEEKSGWLEFSLAGEVKRSIAAIFLFALAIVVFLGFLGKAGVVGEYSDKAAASLVGWVKWTMPFFLIVSGAVFLYKGKTSFYVAKIVGLSVTFLALAGIFHWFFEMEKMTEIAKAGKGGGYLGLAVAYLATKYIGEAGGLIVILALFLIGFVVAFNFSLIGFFDKLKNIKKEKELEEGEKSNEENILPNISEENSEIEKNNELMKKVEEEAKKLKKEDDEKREDLDSEDAKNNIGKVKFVEGRDQFVDEKMLDISPNSQLNRKNFAIKKRLGTGKPLSKDGSWVFPPFDILEKGTGRASGGDIQSNAEIIKETLKNFGIDVEVGEAKVGPSVTQYSFRPAIGVKVAKILSLQNDIALALALHPIRIEAPIPGKSLIGIEVPNKVPAMVRMRDILESEEFARRKSNLTLALGQDVSGEYIFGNLDKMPHLLIAGATGTGKSVCVNSIIASLLYQNSPEDLNFLMVDPKRVELSLYNGIPHLRSQVIVDNGKVVNALKWAVGEMERRYKLLQESGSKDIASYKEKLSKGEKRKVVDAETGEVREDDLEKLPYIVIIIDELADLMGSHGKEVEGAIVRLAQMARAIGIHLIVSTQRPSVEVITGLIKANITTRIALQVATQIDSRTIIDMGGAEKLLGNGDLLYLSSSSPKPKRIQGVFVNEEEIKKVVKFIKDQGEKFQKENEVDSSDKEIVPEENSDNKGPVVPRKPVSSGGDLLEFDNSIEDDQNDELYEQAKSEVIKMKKASASLLQRRLRVGYARAARLLDMLEEQGVVGPADGAKPREVFASGEGGVNYEDGMSDQQERDKWNL